MSLAEPRVQYKHFEWKFGGLRTTFYRCLALVVVDIVVKLDVGLGSYDKWTIGITHAKDPVTESWRFPLVVLSWWFIRPDRRTAGNVQGACEATYWCASCNRRSTGTSDIRWQTDRILMVIVSSAYIFYCRGSCGVSVWLLSVQLRP